LSLRYGAGCMPQTRLPGAGPWRRMRGPRSAWCSTSASTCSKSARAPTARSHRALGRCTVPLVSVQLRPLTAPRTPSARDSGAPRADAWCGTARAGRDHEEGLVAADEPVMPEALLFQRPEESLDHPILLRRIGRDVLLVETVASHHADKDLRAEHESVIGPQRERRVAIFDPPIAQRVLQRGRGDPGHARPRQPPADDRPTAAVNDGCQVAPPALP